MEGLKLLGLTPLDVPVPPMLAQALGYSGTARFVALYWDAEIGEARFDDGQTDEEANYEAWDIFINHAAIAPSLEDYEVGDPYPAKHFVLLDREKIEFHGGGALFIGPLEILSETMRPGGVARTETASPAKAPTTEAAWQTIVLRLGAWLDEQLERKI